MIARVLFPDFPSQLANGAQILVPFQSLCMGVAMPPNVRILARRDQYFSLRSVSVETIVHFALVVTAITGKMVNRLLDLLEQGFHHVSITDAILSQGHCLDLAALRICPNMQFAPDASLGLAMRSHLPFTFTID